MSILPRFLGAPPNSRNILPAWVHPHKEQTNSTRIIAFIEILEVYILDLPPTTGCNRHHEGYEISSVRNPNLNLQLNHSYCGGVSNPWPLTSWQKKHPMMAAGNCRVGKGIPALAKPSYLNQRQYVIPPL